MAERTTALPQARLRDTTSSRPDSSEPKPYGKQFNTQPMSVQVSYGIHTKISKEDRLLGDAGRYLGYYLEFLQMERCGGFGEKSDVKPHSSDAIDTTPIFCILL